MSFDEFLKIREVWAEQWPLMEEEYKRTGNMHFDPYFHDWKMTPIEQKAWVDIRSMGLPMFPQFPVLNYFLDFANPFLKVGLECDGKEWHDEEKDAERDARLVCEGWTVYRVTGAECNKIVEPWEDTNFDWDGNPQAELIEDYFLNTSSGVVDALKRHYLGGNEKYSDLVSETLQKHRSIY